MRVKIDLSAGPAGPKALICRMNGLLQHLVNFVVASQSVVHFRSRV